MRVFSSSWRGGVFHLFLISGIVGLLLSGCGKDRTADENHQDLVNQQQQLIDHVLGGNTWRGTLTSPTSHAVLGIVEMNMHSHREGVSNSENTTNVDQVTVEGDVTLYAANGSVTQVRLTSGSYFSEDNSSSGTATGSIPIQNNNNYGSSTGTSTSSNNTNNVRFNGDVAGTHIEGTFSPDGPVGFDAHVSLDKGASLPPLSMISSHTLGSPQLGDSQSYKGSYKEAFGRNPSDVTVQFIVNCLGQNDSQNFLNFFSSQKIVSVSMVFYKMIEGALTHYDDTSFPTAQLNTQSGRITGTNNPETLSCSHPLPGAPAPNNDPNGWQCHYTNDAKGIVHDFFATPGTVAVVQN